MSTPESNKMTLNAVHSNGAIRKSLLTPYRRIGLSRNRQPPKNNSFISPLQNKEPILIDNIPLSPINQNTNEAANENLCTTPILHKLKKSNNNNTKRNENPSQDKTCQGLDLVEANAQKIKSNERRKISGENQQEERHDNYSSFEDKTDKMIAAKDSSLDSKIVLEDITSEYSRNKTVDTNLVKSALDSAFEKDIHQIDKKAKVCDYTNSDSYTNDDHDYAIISKENSIAKIVENDSQCNVQEVTNNLKKDFLSVNLDASVIVRRVDDNCKKKNEKVNREIKISSAEDTLITSTKETVHNIKLKEKSSKSIKRKFSLRKTMSNLNDSSEISNTTKEQDNKIVTNQDSSKIIDEMIKLEVLVEHKEEELRRLQQAQIYRNIHKIDDLHAETDIWKNGCQDALRDLLIKLNEHYTIEMNGLLSNLKVPSHLISYDSENDCFL